MEKELEERITERVAECVTARQCIYERKVEEGGEWGLWDRTVFAGARRQANGWVQATLAAGLTEGRIMAGLKGQHWKELAKAVVKVGGEPARGEDDDMARGIGIDGAQRANMI